MGFESFPEPNIEPEPERQSEKQEESPVDTNYEFPEKEISNEEQERLIKETVSQNIENDDFKKEFSPTNPEQVNEEVFERGLDTLLNTENTELSQSERLRLFRETLEYYSSEPEAEKPLMHSTGSYSFRKGLEEGFSGGHGSFSGEASVEAKETDEVQKGLSVTHPEYASAESFQQLFARLSSKKEDYSKYLSIDSEKITNKTIPEVFVKELLASLSKEEMREMVSKRKGITIEDVDDESLEKMIGEDAQKAFIEDFNQRQYLPNLERIKKEVLPEIEDNELRTELEIEAEHPFPCMVTFESAGKEEHLTTVSRGEKPTHIPFEDFYWDKLEGEDIREVRVPQNQREKVEKWLEDKNLKDVKIVPIEVFEVKRIIQESI